MSNGRPWMQKTWSKTMTAVSMAEGSLRSGSKWTTFENLSTTARTMVLPLDGARYVTKSMAMWDQGLEGIGNGRRSLTGSRLEPLPTAHTGQFNKKFWASYATDRHQNRCLISTSIRSPGWQASLEEWTHWKMLVRRNHPVGLHDGHRRRGSSLSFEDPWECVRFTVLTPRAIGDGEVKTPEE